MNEHRVGWAVRAAATLVLAFLALPILIIFPLAFNSSDYLRFPPTGFSMRWMEKVANDAQWLLATGLSLQIAIVSTVLAVALSLLVAVPLVRGKVRFKQGVYALVLLPMIVPNIISAMAMFFFFSEAKAFSSTLAIAIGHTVVAMPIAVIILSSTLQGVDVRLENAAMSLGASRWTAFRRITLPLIAPGLASAAIFSFLSSFDELLIAMFMGGQGTQTLPVRIWSTVVFQLDPSIAAISALLVLLSAFALFLSQTLANRRR